MSKIKNLVIGGGGPSGISFVGVLNVLNENNILDNVQTYIGTSVGSFICLLLIIGYPILDIRDFCYNFDFYKLKNEIDINILLTEFGFHNNDKLAYVIKRLITNKGYSYDITFKELYDITTKKLIISATCLNNHKICYFDYTNKPDMPIWIAIIMSSCIPIIFQPVKYEEYYYVDGGILDNFPIHLVNDEISETIGIACIDECFFNPKKNEIDDILKYLFTLIKCTVQGKVEEKIRKHIDHIILINIQHTDLSNFSLSLEDKKIYFNYGYEKAMEYIARKKDIIQEKNLNNENNIDSTEDTKDIKNNIDSTEDTKDIK